MQLLLKFLDDFANCDERNRQLKLIRHDKSQISYDTVLENNKYVMLYFAAHWAPSCQRFTPFLADFYTLYHSVLSFEVIFVSLDRTEKHMLEFYNGIKSNYVRRDRAAMRQFLTNAKKAREADNIYTNCNNNAIQTKSLTTVCKRNANEHVIIQDDALLIPFADTHGDWLALPFSEKHIAKQWMRKCSVVGVPQLVILESATNTIVNTNAMSDVMNVMRLLHQSSISNYMTAYEMTKLQSFPWLKPIQKSSFNTKKLKGFHILLFAFFPLCILFLFFVNYVNSIKFK